MSQTSLRHLTIYSLLSSVALFGCESAPKEKDLAPEATALKADVKTADSQTFEVAQKSSSVTFDMDAELEEIAGKAPGSVSGSLDVDLMDVTKSRGLIKVDLGELVIFQRKRKSADEEFGEEVKSDKQNEHMKTWLEISEDAPAPQREKNRYAEFKIESVKTAASPDVSKMSGETRKVMVDVEGSIRLHGRVSKKSLSAELVFSYAGDKPASLRVVTKTPLEVSLEKHDVRPRTAFNVLADKTLDALGAKVSKVAKVSLDFKTQAK